MRRFADFAAIRSLAVVAHFGRDSINSGDVREAGMWRLDRSVWAGHRGRRRWGSSGTWAVWFVTAGITFCIRPSATTHIISGTAQLDFFAARSNSVLQRQGPILKKNINMILSPLHLKKTNHNERTIV